MGGTLMSSSALTAVLPADKELESARLRRMIAVHQAELNRALASNVKLEAPPDNVRISPRAYPGLRSFSPQEGGLFFGRESNIKDIQRLLAARRVVVVLGGSGSGKSSVIRAGLMPRLNSTLVIEGCSGNWYTAEFRPRQQPMDELVESLAALVRNKFPDQGGGIPAPGDESSSLPHAKAVRDANALLERLRRQFQLEDTRDVSTEPGERKRRADTLADALFDFVDKELDHLDDVAARGLRSGHASLLLVIDQFEEIFRPEVPATRTGGRQDLLDLIIAIDARLQAERDQESKTRSGLFLAITMRSEELHRCSEHPSLVVDKENARQRSLADLVNSSGYLLDLLDPVQDRKQLTQAIAGPARGVFKDWGLWFNEKDPHAPFDHGVVDWLLHGAALLLEQLEHRADLLPLLQHGLQTTWHNAINDWQNSGDAAPLLIRRRHLLGGETDDERPADFITCLDSRAERAFENARKRFLATAKGRAVEESDAESGATDGASTDPITWLAKRLTLALARIKGTPGPDTSEDQESSEAVICAAFRALARRDDRGNWARRFAEVDRVSEFVRADPATIIIRMAGPNVRLHQVEREFIVEGLQEFIASGYLTGGHGHPYDISHEALIRNWDRFQRWLQTPDEASQALTQTINLLNPEKPSEAISAAVARSLAPVVSQPPTLPESWAKEQILPLLARRDLKRKWGVEGNLDQAASHILAEIGKAWRAAERDRYGRDLDSYWRNEYEREKGNAQRLRSILWFVAGGAVLMGLILLFR
jgi:hypothetical protein